MIKEKQKRNGILIEMIEGDMPTRAAKMVKDWAKKYNKDLMDMWKTRKYRQLPGLE